MSKIKLALIGIVVGLVLGIGGTLFVQSTFLASKDNPPISVVFQRIVEQNELVTASEDYSITEKAKDSASFFDLFEIPFTENSYWYRYVGTIKAGINLGDAKYSEFGNTITVELSKPYIISNTPNMDETGCIDKQDNFFNPIKIEDVEALRQQCVEMSEKEILAGGLLEEAQKYAEEDIRDMFNAAVGDAYTIEFKWRD